MTETGQPPGHADGEHREIIRIGPPDPARTVAPVARESAPQARGSAPQARATESAPRSKATWSVKRVATAAFGSRRKRSVQPEGSAHSVIELRGIGLRSLGSPRGGPHRPSVPRPPSQRRRGQPAHEQPAAEQPAADGLWQDRPYGAHGPGQPPEPGLVSLSVGHGELVTLTGPAGSGKSALLHVIGLVDRPTTGSYLLNGLDVARLDDRDRAALRGRLIGLQFQRPHLLPPRSTLDNVELPLRYVGLPRPQREAAALAALDRVGLADRAQLVAAQLSAAERKLVAIARAMAADPSLLLFDDPTADLDPATATRVIDVLLGLHRDGKTVLIATDDQFAAAYCAQRIALVRPARGTELSARR